MSYKNRYAASKKSSKSKASNPNVTRFNSVIEKIRKIEYWAKYDVQDITKDEDGDAYIVADTLIQEDKIDNSQLRKFYNEALDGYIALTHPSKKDMEKAKTVIAMIVPRAYYARERGNFKDIFLDFIKASCDLSKFRFDNYEKVKDDYKKFIQFFEALVGYHKYLKSIRH